MCCDSVDRITVDNIILMLYGQSFPISSRNMELRGQSQVKKGDGDKLKDMPDRRMEKSWGNIPVTVHR